MTLTGRVVGGTIKIDGDGKLAEGSVVRIETVEDTQDISLSDALVKLAGTAVGLPEDSSVNLDHYLYGVPKR